MSDSGTNMPSLLLGYITTCARARPTCGHSASALLHPGSACLQQCKQCCAEASPKQASLVRFIALRTRGSSSASFLATALMAEPGTSPDTMASPRPTTSSVYTCAAGRAGRLPGVRLQAYRTHGSGRSQSGVWSRFSSASALAIDTRAVRAPATSMMHHCVVRQVSRGVTRYSAAPGGGAPGGGPPCGRRWAHARAQGQEAPAAEEGGAPVAADASGPGRYHARHRQPTVVGHSPSGFRAGGAAAAG